jgi:hypothetical protein
MLQLNLTSSEMCYYPSKSNNINANKSNQQHGILCTDSSFVKILDHTNNKVVPPPTQERRGNLVRMKTTESLRSKSKSVKELKPMIELRQESAVNNNHHCVSNQMVFLDSYNQNKVEIKISNIDRIIEVEPEGTYKGYRCHKKWLIISNGDKELVSSYYSSDKCTCTFLNLMFSHKTIIAARHQIVNYVPENMRNIEANFNTLIKSFDLKELSHIDINLLPRNKDEILLILAQVESNIYDQVAKRKNISLTQFIFTAEGCKWVHNTTTNLFKNPGFSVCYNILNENFLTIRKNSKEEKIEEICYEDHPVQDDSESKKKKEKEKEKKKIKLLAKGEKYSFTNKMDIKYISHWLKLNSAKSIVSEFIASVANKIREKDTSIETIIRNESLKINAIKEDIRKKHENRILSVKEINDAQILAHQQKIENEEIKEEEIISEEQINGEDRVVKGIKERLAEELDIINQQAESEIGRINSEMLKEISDLDIENENLIKEKREESIIKFEIEMSIYLGSILNYSKRLSSYEAAALAIAKWEPGAENGLLSLLENLNMEITSKFYESINNIYLNR